MFPLESEKNVKFYLKEIESQLMIPKGVRCFIAGGTLFQLFRNRSCIKDFDIYAESYDDFHMLESHFLAGFDVIVETNNAITFNNVRSRPNIQLIKKRMGQPWEVLALFDFTVCAVAYEFWSGRFHYHPMWHTDMKQQNLRLGSQKGMFDLSYRRLQKYVSHGMKPVFDYHNMCNQCRGRLACLTSGSKECLKTEDDY